MIPDRDRPTAVTFSDTHLHVTLANGRIIPVALAQYPTLAAATSQQRTNLQLGLANLYWPDLNLDIALLDLLRTTAAPIRHHKPRFCEG